MIKDQKFENQFLANASQNNRPYSKFPHCGFTAPENVYMHSFQAESMPHYYFVHALKYDVQMVPFSLDRSRGEQQHYDARSGDASQRGRRHRRTV